MEGERDEKKTERRKQRETKGRQVEPEGRERNGSNVGCRCTDERARAWRGLSESSQSDPAAADAAARHCRDTGETVQTLAADALAV